MPRNKNEQIKIYLIIVLLVVAVGVAYFRFFHKKRTPPPDPARANTVGQTLTVPEIDIRHPSAGGSRIDTRDAGVTGNIRNIFKPVPRTHSKDVPTDAEEVLAEAAEVTGPPDFKLAGILSGGDRPIAVIGESFVRENDIIDQYRVVEITAQSVRLASGGREFVLTLMDQTQ